MSDHLKHKKKLTSDCMNESELEEYLELIKIAYPQLKDSVKDKVMARIRNSEGEQIEQLPSDELCCAIVGTKQRHGSRATREKIGRILLRYGSLAACLAIVALAGFKLLPSYMNRAGSASSDNAVYMDSLDIQNKAAVKQSIPMPFAASAEEGAIAEENEVDDADASLYSSYSDIPEGDGADTAKAYAESIVEEEKTVSNGNIMFSMSGALYDCADGAPYGLYKYTPVSDCAHSSAFRNSYHDIPRAMINLVGEDEFNNWAYETSLEDRCGVNIASFYEYFSGLDSGFSAEFTALLLGDTAYYCDYPAPELFTEGRFDEIEEYYSGGGELEKAIGNYFEYKFKTALISKAGVSIYTGWLDKCGIKYMSDWSIADITGAFGFTAEELSEVYGDVKAKLLKEYPDAALFSYDFAKITNDAQNSAGKMSSGVGEGRLKDAEYRII